MPMPMPMAMAMAMAVAMAMAMAGIALGFDSVTIVNDKNYDLVFPTTLSTSLLISI